MKHDRHQVCSKLSTFAAMTVYQEPRILMVCLGNICRSPMAEGILRHKAALAGMHMEIDSAGTGGWHAGEHPDERAIATLQNHGVDISRLVARQFQPEDFDRFDRIFVMDASNYNDVKRMAPSAAHLEKVEMILNLIRPGHNQPVPDPYYGGLDGFENVYRLLDTACEKIIESLNR